jgi:hypothetical protein
MLVVATLAALLAIGIPAAAVANSGVPTIMLTWPLAIVLLLPIVFVEAWLVQRLLSVPYRRALKISGLANLASTLVGIPLTHILFAPITMGAAWTAVALHAPRWAQSVAFAILGSPTWVPDVSQGRLSIATIMLAQFPLFFASVLVERLVVRRLCSPDLAPRVALWSWRANEVSYGLVLGLLAIPLALGR